MPKKYFHFEISERKVLLRFFDVVWVLFTLYLVGIIFELEYFTITSAFFEWGAVLALYLTIFGTVFELYDLQKASKFYSVFKNVFLAASVTVLFFLFTPFFTPVLPDNRIQIVYFYLVVLLTLLLWRYFYIIMISSPRFYKRVLIIGDLEKIEKVVTQLHRSDPHYNIIGYINTNHDHKILPKEVKMVEFPSNGLAQTIKQNSIDEILISNTETDDATKPVFDEILTLLKSGFTVRDSNQVYEEKTFRIPVEHIEKDFYKFFPFSRSHNNKLYLFIQRFADIIVSVSGLFFGMLLIPFILIGNFFGNKGRLFYRQKRVGKNGRIFEIVKFRSMRTNAESNGAQWAKKNDLRITKFGKFLRRSRLDEFPQFYNILKGDMSVIGPRPERPVFVQELKEMIHFYDTRHVIKPGLTGWAQVMTEYGDSHADSLEKLQYDLYYIKHRNVFLDLTILVKTLSTIIFYRGQ